MGTDFSKGGDSRVCHVPLQRESRQCADTNIAMTLDAALLASIFVALISLLDILCLSLSLGLLALLSLILRGAAARLKDPSPCLL